MIVILYGARNKTVKVTHVYFSNHNDAVISNNNITTIHKPATTATRTTTTQQRHHHKHNHHYSNKNRITCTCNFPPSSSRGKWGPSPNTKAPPSPRNDACHGALLPTTGPRVLPIGIMTMHDKEQDGCIWIMTILATYQPRCQMSYINNMKIWLVVCCFILEYPGICQSIRSSAWLKTSTRNVCAPCATGTKGTGRLPQQPLCRTCCLRDGKNLFPGDYIMMVNDGY